VFPNDPWDQLRGAAGAVFGSWMNDRAIVYRRKYNIPTEWGTAVNVQAMVLRQHRRNLRFRRGVHPQPGERRE
jgi:phosphoenolpyruvate synthase/pyruvate phosphate dikinase